MSPPKSSAEQIAVPLPADISASIKTAASTVRVDIDKLDRILNTVGELTLIKNNARSLWLDMSETYGRTPQVLDFYKLVQNFNRRLLELQDEILESLRCSARTRR
jgi:two-component system chemotaxis sensor kinase CheA